jgi:hypothetical protein
MASATIGQNVLIRLGHTQPITMGMIKQVLLLIKCADLPKTQPITRGLIKQALLLVKMC